MQGAVETEQSVVKQNFMMNEIVSRVLLILMLGVQQFQVFF
jgi:hypothetical protein